MMVPGNKALDTEVTSSSIQTQIPPLQLRVHKNSGSGLSEIEVFLVAVGEGSPKSFQRS